MKKLLATMLSVLMLCSLVFVPTACSLLGGKDNTGGDVTDEDETFVGSDTFKGALSEESYETETKAVEAFLATEISGEVVTAKLEDVETKKELTQTEIAALETEDVLEEDDEIVSAKEVEVKYTRAKSSVGLTAADATTEDDYFIFTVYIIEISPHGSTVHVFHYYVPKAENGDVLTKSYFNDVLDPSKYMNCTQEYTNDVSMPAFDFDPSSVNPDTFDPNNIKYTTATGQMKYTIKVADDKASVDMRIINTENWMMYGPLPYSDILGYFEMKDGQFLTWMKKDEGEYQKFPQNPFLAYGITDMESFASMCLPQIDYSYYEKTSYGFKVNEDFLNEYILKSLQSVASSIVSSQAELKVYVQDGKIVQMKASCSYVSNALPGADLTSSTQECVIFKDFGTTVVTKPAEIAD